MDNPPTAFAQTARLLRQQLREAVLDHDAFETTLHPCELATCRATCCHDGAVLTKEEEATIQQLLMQHREAFAECSITADTPPVARDGGILKTAVRPANDGELADDFPDHFPRTRCVFLDASHKCTLQRLSSSLGHHPWFYKPISCWMHPVLLRAPNTPSERPTLTLLDEGSDRANFASCTHCGRADSDGIPAREALAAELAALSALADRDFLSELHAPGTESR